MNPEPESKNITASHTQTMKRKPQLDGDGNGGEESSGGTNSKRPREEDPTIIDVDHDAAASASPNTKPPAPKYGTKEYWEARYKSHLPGVDLLPEAAAVVSENNNGTTNTNTTAAAAAAAEGKKEEDPNKTGETSYILDGVVLSNSATKPGHEWYFSYDELRPLILPLILGDLDNEVVESDYDDDAESWVEEEDEEEEKKGGSKEEGEEVLAEEEEEDGNEDAGAAVSDSDTGDNAVDNEKPKAEKDSTNENAQEDGEETDSRCVGTERKPKRILEVGCGDKPLGTPLVSDLISMQVDTGCKARSVVEEVTCIDYSEIVVQSLIENQKKEEVEQEDQTSSPAKKDGAEQQQQSQTNTGNLQPTFRALDARSLPFSPNTYDLILEKGTLDAMLSDDEEGLSNCVQIVKEMARVTSEGGAILIVSHLNANEPKGMGWLEDVVFRGLKDEFLERHELLELKLNKAKKTAGEEEAPKEEQEEKVADDGGYYEKEYVWSVEVHGGDGKFLDANGDEIEHPDKDAVPIYGPAVYIIRKKSVPASIARELFGKKKKKGSAEEEEAEGKEEGEDKAEGREEDKDDDGDEEEELTEMPPVKLSFVTYGGED